MISRHGWTFIAAGAALILAVVTPVAAVESIVQEAQYAKNAGQLQHHGAGYFIHKCQAGQLQGYAYVRSDVGSQWTQVEGFYYKSGGPPGNCITGSPEAVAISPGVVDVRFGSEGTSCSSAHDLPVVVTPVGDGVTASVTRDCYQGADSTSWAEQVHVYNSQTTPISAPFTLGLLFDPYPAR